MLPRKGVGLQCTACFLILFSFLFIQLGGASGEDLSISGTKFLDMDENGVKSATEPGLADYTIYLDKNNNSKMDSDEDSVLTDENGKYNLNKLSKGTYIIRESISNEDKLLPSFPQSGYYSVNLTDKNVTGKDFGNTIPSSSGRTDDPGKSLSISGTKFLDMDANGAKSATEPGLVGYAIYLDNNKNTVWDSDEDRVLTEGNGNYTFNKLSRGTYTIRELVLSGNKLVPSFPQSGYYLVNLTDNNITGKDFGSTIPSPISETAILIVLALFAAFFIAGGFFALYRGFSEMKSLEEKQNSNKKIKIKTIQIQVASGFILLILGLFLLITLLQYSRDITGRGAILANNSSSLVIPGVITILIFIAVLAMLYTQTKLKQMDDTSGMRKTISGLLVVGLIVVVLFALSGTINDANQNIITQFIQLVGVVIAFYFGSRATESAYKDAISGKADEGDAEKDLDINKVTYNSNKKEINIEISNNKKRNFTLKKISIMEGDTEIISKDLGERASETLNSHTAIVQDKDEKIEEGKEYKIVIETSIGKKTATKTIRPAA